MEPRCFFTSTLNQLTVFTQGTIFSWWQTHSSICLRNVIQTLKPSATNTSCTWLKVIAILASDGAESIFLPSGLLTVVHLKSTWLAAKRKRCSTHSRGWTRRNVNVVLASPITSGYRSLVELCLTGNLSLQCLSKTKSSMLNPGGKQKTARVTWRSVTSFASWLKLDLLSKWWRGFSLNQTMSILSG